MIFRQFKLSLQRYFISNDLKVVLNTVSSADLSSNLNISAIPSPADLFLD